MFVLKENQAIIDKKFEEVINLAGCKKDEILKGLSLCDELEKSYMKFLYVSMPLSDLANYPFDLFLEFARHAVFLRKNMICTKEIPEDIFLNYVLFYRVNNENIEDCRKIFYDLINPRVKNKSMTEAALEVNYWCLEQMTYRSTDERTAAPLTVLRSAYGRCGEESTFAVTALRSVGIPARQVYVPRWSHCDDNHAWVEVWCDGKWHYLGACEPEPVLDKGWFNAAASRAMLITSKVFSQIINEEEVISKNHRVSVINNIKKYADSRKVTVKIIDGNNIPVADVQVNFQVLNYSEFFSAASAKTDKDGVVSITLGLGSVNINAVKSGRFINRLVNTEIDDFVLLNWADAAYKQESLKDFDIIAPKDNMNFVITLKAQENILAKERFQKSNNRRKEKESKFYNDTRAEKTAGIYKIGNEYIKSILIKSKANYMEIENFLNDKEDYIYFPDKLGMLKVLTDKDYLDITKELLDNHFNYSSIYKYKYPKDIFERYLLNPRIYYEQITNYRKFILGYFSISDQGEFKDQPEKIWSYIQQNICEMPEEEYEELYTLPVGALEIKSCSIMSKKILFAAVCRSLGIPARINKEDLSLEYYKENKFIKIKEENQNTSTKLRLLSMDDTNWIYMQNWSLGVLENGAYKTLNLTEREWTEGKLCLELVPNNYRVITTNRVPNGSILSKEYSFILPSGEEKEIGISLRKAKITDMLKNVEISDFKLIDGEGNQVMGGDIFEENKNIVLWLEEGKEPTEHILNEMIALKDVFNVISSNIIFVLKSVNSLSNEKLKETLKAIPHIRLYYDDFNYNVSTIARRMYLNPDELPLIIVTRDGLNVVYSFSGYNVGITDLIIKVIRAIQESK